MNFSAYDEGISDFHAGRYRNPYIAGSMQFAEYQHGYESAEKDFIFEVTGLHYHEHQSGN